MEGRVSGAAPGERVVLFALSGVWWVQPFENEPFTAIHLDPGASGTTWKSATHPGTAYAALLVDARYRPPLDRERAAGKGRSGAGRGDRERLHSEFSADDASVQRIPMGGAANGKR